MQIEIVGLAQTGEGVGHLDGKVIFVPLTCPGDIAEIKILEEKKRFARGELQSLVVPSDDRVAPPCAIFHQCGGCDWQHISYANQIKWKETNLIQNLKRIAGLDIPIHPTIASAREYQYRNRAQFHIKNKQLHFFKKNSSQMVAVKDCPVLEDSLREELKKPWNEKQTQGRLEFKINKKTNHVDRIWLENNLPSGGFTQINTEQNNKMIGYVVSLISAENNPSKIFDFYCGNGNFTIPIAKKFSNTKVIGVDVVTPKVDLDNSYENLSFIGQPVENYMLSKVSPGATVLIDPPRSGCSSKFLTALVACQPKSIIYISCNPATLARDLKHLSLLYSAAHCQPFDMFPQTPHMESVVLLRAKTQ